MVSLNSVKEQNLAMSTGKTDSIAVSVVNNEPLELVTEIKCFGVLIKSCSRSDREG